MSSHFTISLNLCYKVLKIIISKLINVVFACCTVGPIWPIQILSYICKMTIIGTVYVRTIPCDLNLEVADTALHWEHICNCKNPCEFFSPIFSHFRKYISILLFVTFYNVSLKYSKYRWIIGRNRGKNYRMDIIHTVPLFIEILSVSHENSPWNDFLDSHQKTPSMKYSVYITPVLFVGNDLSDILAHIFPTLKNYPAHRHPRYLTPTL